MVLAVLPGPVLAGGELPGEAAPAKIGAHDDWLRTFPHGYRPMSPASPRRLHRVARHHFLTQDP
jgi:hypothetical protein